MSIPHYLPYLYKNNWCGKIAWIDKTCYKEANSKQQMAKGNKKNYLLFAFCCLFVIILELTFPISASDHIQLKDLINHPNHHQ